MLIGYNVMGEIKFIFTDELYLNNHFPNNTAKISNFWNIKDHGLKELFIPIAAWNNFTDPKRYKVINGNLTLKNKEEITVSESPKVHKQGLFLQSGEKDIIKLANFPIIKNREIIKNAKITKFSKEKV